MSLRRSVFSAALLGMAATLALSTPGAAQAQPVAVAPSPALKLFADSTIVTKPRFSVEIVGHGPDIVLIPGLASSRETFRHSAERLRGRYRLHLVQVAGFAGEPSRANASGPVFDPLAEDVDAYMTSLGRAPIVVGHSFGGTLALALAERHPDHMAKVFIVDSLPFYGVIMGGPAATADSVRPMAEAMRGHTATRMSDAQSHAMMSQMVSAPADVDRVVAWGQSSDPNVVVRAMTDDMLADLRPDLGKVRVPITVIHEAALGPLMTSGYAALGPKTLVSAKPGVLHFIMYDDPAGFDAALDAFLAK